MSMESKQPADPVACALHQMALAQFNRHKARLLGNLEDANCPRAYVESVRADFDYCRKDILDLIGGQE